MEEEYKRAQRYIADPNNPPLPTSNEQKLEFYGLFKQITSGPPKDPAPSRFNVIARAKYMAWSAKAKLSKEQAYKEYVALLDNLAPNWRLRSKL